MYTPYMNAEAPMQTSALQTEKDRKAAMVASRVGKEGGLHDDEQVQTSKKPIEGSDLSNLCISYSPDLLA